MNIFLGVASDVDWSDLENFDFIQKILFLWSVAIPGEDQKQKKSAWIPSEYRGS